MTTWVYVAGTTLVQQKPDAAGFGAEEVARGSGARWSQGWHRIFARHFGATTA